MVPAKVPSTRSPHSPQQGNEEFGVSRKELVNVSALETEHMTWSRLLHGAGAKHWECWRFGSDVGQLGGEGGDDAGSSEVLRMQESK